MNQRNHHKLRAEKRLPHHESTKNQAPQETTLAKVMRLVEAQDFQAALALLRDTRQQPPLRNALGICLMRLGRTEDAVRIYRDLVLKTGCTWMIPDLPMAYKVNFATALFLDGRPSGTLEMLHEVNADSHPSVVRLRAAIRKWESGLTWWHWLNWRFGRIDPPTRPMTLDYPAGDFGIAPEVVPNSSKTSPTTPLHTVA